MGRRPPTVHGLAIVDKPAGLTSHDVVGLLRRRFNERRIGHAGTLDPSATGVLVVGVGSVTRLLRFVAEGTKRYTGEVVLGVETDTQDADGEIVATHDMGTVTLDDARRAAASFTGEILQVPPMVSARHVAGRRLYELAREGLEVEREARPVTVDRFAVLGWAGHGVLSIEVTCSTGTYVRTLAADLGAALGGGAHLRHLRRTAVEPFTIAEATPPDECPLLPPITAVRSLPMIVADEATRAAISVGQVLPAPSGHGPWAMVNATDELLAVYEPHGVGRAKPAVVLAGGTG